MLDYDEKRNYMRMNVDCDITYKTLDGSDEKRGHCTSLSGAGLSFIADTPFEPGLAMDVCVEPKKSLTPPMDALIEVVRCTEKAPDQYEIAATIKSIKG